MGKLRLMNISKDCFKINLKINPMSGNTVKELEEYFENKHEWQLSAWEYNYADVMFTNDLGPR